MICSCVPVKSLDMAKSYYSNSDKPVKDDYYANDNENDIWGGKLSKEIGLNGKVHHAEFETVLNDIHSRLKPLMRTGEEPTLGADLTFSSCKSISLAIANEKPEISMILESNRRKAIAETMKIVERDFLSKNISTSRLLNGVEREYTGQAIYAEFSHGLSRYMDLQSHGHVFISNETIDSTGKPCSIDIKYLMEHQKTIGAICRNLELKYNLESGFRFREGKPDKKGNIDYELVGYSDELLEENSRARKAIEEYLESHGMEDNAKNCQIAWNAIRPSKSEHANIDDIREEARETCRRYNARAEMEDNPQELKMTKDEGEEVFARTINELQNKSYAFTRNELELALLNNGTLQGMTWEECKNLINDSRELVCVGMRQDKPTSSKVYYTTKDNIKLQEAMVKRMEECKGTGHKIASKQIEIAMEKVRERTGAVLKEEQADFVKNFLSSSSRSYVLNGKPGTGKTFVMKYASETLQELGYRPQDIQGAAFQKAAAIELEQDSGIKSDTVDSLLLSKEREAYRARGEAWEYNGNHGREYDFSGLPKLERPAVLVVDEAGMVNDIKLKALFDLSNAVSTKEAPLTLLFSGDYRQIQAIGIGGGYERMANREGGRVPPVPASYLEDITRQKDEALRETVLSIVNDESVSKSFQLLHQRSLDNTMEQWEQEQSTIIKADNAGIAEELNRRIRSKRKERGELRNERTFELRPKRATKTEPEPKPQKIELAEGDRVIISSSKTGGNKDKYPKAQQTFTIERIQDGAIHGRAEDGKEYTVYADKLQSGQIRHAYAVDSKQAAQLDKGMERSYIVAHGGLREISDPKEMESAAVDEYMMRATAGNGKTVALSVETNAQRQRLNRMIRERMQELGDVSKDGYNFKVDNGQNPLTPDGKRNRDYKTQKIEVAKGDRLICLKNNKKAGLYNNLEGTVKSIDQDGNMELLTKSGTIKANIKDFPCWDYAHAKTVNKLQGATVDTIITIEDRSNRNAHFVAVSRARTEGIIFTANRQRLEKSAELWADKVTQDSFKPTTEHAEYKTPEQRAAIIRGIRQPTGAEIAELQEQDKALGHPLKVEEIQSHVLPPLAELDEEKELLQAFERLGDKPLPFELKFEPMQGSKELAWISKQFCIAIDRTGRKYLFPVSKSENIPQNGHDMAKRLKLDFELLRKAKANPHDMILQAEAMKSGVRIAATGKLATSNRLIPPRVASGFKLPSIPAFNIVTMAIKLPVEVIKTGFELTIKSTQQIFKIVQKVGELTQSVNNQQQDQRRARTRGRE